LDEFNPINEFYTDFVLEKRVTPLFEDLITEFDIFVYSFRLNIVYVTRDYQCQLGSTFSYSLLGV
jgi:hypothetical protein